MKKYTLKPGMHQFAPGSPPVHTNDNLTDKEAEWYLKKYPHIKELFTSQPPELGIEETPADPSTITKRKIKRVETTTHPFGGKEDK